MIFILQFINVVHHIDWFADIAQLLYPWDKSHLILVCVHASSVTFLCLTLCNPLDSSLPGSSVHGVFQARVLEWGVLFFSRGSSQTRDWTCTSCTGWWILYCWATWEAEDWPSCLVKPQVLLCCWLFAYFALFFQPDYNLYKIRFGDSFILLFSKAPSIL